MEGKVRLTVVVVLCLLGALAGAAAADTVSIGIIQIVEHPALDLTREGMMDALEQEGFGDAEFEFHTAQGEFSVAAAISQQLVANNVDLIGAIATPTSQAAANATTDIPIVFAAVTDPVDAGLVASVAEPGGNVTGVSDLTPVAAQLELLQSLVEGNRVGIIYNPGEANSLVQVDIADEAAEALGLTLVKAGVNSSAEVMQAAQSLVGRVDAIYVPTDNTAASAYGAIIQVAEDNQLPLIVGEDTAVEQGGLATLGVNYYDIGFQAGLMAAQILRGADPATIPVGYQETLRLAVNLSAAEKMGVEFDPEWLETADMIIE